MTSYEFGGFRLDGARRVLWRGSEIVPLPPRALDLLLALVERSGEVVTKQELMERVWPDTFVEEANLSVNVSLLRKALGEQAGGAPFIETLSRRGYRFVAETRRAEATPGPRSLAVLPFRPLSESEDDAALGLGMADALITRLSSLGQILVRPTGAVAKYAGGDPQQAGRALRVDAVVDGRLQRVGTRLRLTAQLIAVEKGGPAWADMIETDASDPFAAQDRVAEQLAAALALRLGGPEQELLARRPTTSVAAYEAHAKGRYFWSRLTAASMSRAIGCFQEAAELDPGYAAPHAGLADALVAMGFSGAIPPSEAWPLALAEAEKALALDARLPEPRIARAYVRLFQAWDWDFAERELVQAARESPLSPSARQWLGLFLAMRGRIAEARREVQEAYLLDPVSLIANTMLGFLHCLSGDHETEAEQYRRTLELDPNQFLGYWGLGNGLTHLACFQEAEAALRRAVELTEGSPFLRAVLAWSLAEAGRGGEARAELAALDGPDTGYASPYQRATVLSALGDADAAMAALEQAAEARDPWLVWLRVDPMLAALRHRPDLARLSARTQPPA
ncbi:MAG TPA: winged helix-turn-helix domain-containing protein [Vicinamibacteria bacterium]|nr:winged helix-turn-helix domain-containing protein [Vicinamibacteria bacterium]